MACIARRRNPFGKGTSVDELAHGCRAQMQLCRDRSETVSLLPLSHDSLIPGEPTRARCLGCRHFSATACLFVSRANGNPCVHLALLQYHIDPSHDAL